MNPITITRNGVDWLLTQFEILKGDNKGKKYLAPDLLSDKSEWDSARVWFGEMQAMSVLQTAVKRYFQEIYADNVDQTTGEFNEAKFVKEATDFTSGGMKLSELRAKIDEETARLTLRVTTASPALFSDASWQAETTEIGTYINVLKAMAEERSRKKKDVEVDAEASVPAV